MSEIIVYIALCFALPILLLCFYLEKRARRIVISMICGTLACLLAFFIEGVLFELFSFDNILNVCLTAPIVEEILKFIPVVIIAFLVKKRKTR